MNFGFIKLAISENDIKVPVKDIKGEIDSIENNI